MPEEFQIEKKISVEKGRQGLLKVVFGRTTIMVLITILQLVFLLACFYFLRENVLYAYWLSQLLVAGIVIYIINRPGAAEFKIAWIVPILLLPIFGSLFYLFFHFQVGGKILNRHIQSMEELAKGYLQTEKGIKEELRNKDPRVANLAQYLEEHGNFPTFRNTTVKYFPLGEDKFIELKLQLQKAKKFVFLEYFIIAEGVMWGTILDILKKKVAEGVEVRLMYDGTCTLALLPPQYPKMMEKLGIKCKVFAPIRPALTTSQNNRDHRKILVIDGKTAFVGGTNLADEYINQKVRFGHWKDTAVMLRGEAVRSFTEMFLQMWNVADRQNEDYSHYLECEGFLGAYGAPGYVIPYGDNPFDKECVGEMVYLNMINTAIDYVHIMTPYLILDQETIMALTFAAKRGIDVKIIMPSIPDKVYAFALAKTYYPQLIAAGVKIYEYTPGFIHAKVFVVDGNRATVGTINMDFRSFYLHFECGVYMYEVPQIIDIEADYQDTLDKSEQITLDMCKKEKLGTRLIGKILRLFAPLM
jgi:Phosphatidylserine/phosphatidylglycerophosphate/cardiolipin synthases and related enzymes